MARFSRQVGNTLHNVLRTETRPALPLIPVTITCLDCDLLATFDGYLRPDGLIELLDFTARHRRVCDEHTFRASIGYDWENEGTSYNRIAPVPTKGSLKRLYPSNWRERLPNAHNPRPL